MVTVREQQLNDGGGDDEAEKAGDRELRERPHGPRG
jgi:hypothetical protein